MLTPVLEKLLVLQDRDAQKLGLEAQLKAVPQDIALVEARIADEKAALEASRTEVRELETKKKLLETEIGSAEEQVGRYKTQQMQVRKNDEYQALGHQIDTAQAEIGRLEEQELEIMYAIDAARKKFAAAETVLRENISGHEARIAMLKERAVNLAAGLQAAEEAVAAARAPVGEAALLAYGRVASRNMPACVPIRGGKCGGCHLKVSSEVESGVRSRSEEKLTTCDQCGRIVYWEN